MRILIIKTSSLGDIIHALPVLSYLRQAAPNATIDWVVDEAFGDLLTGNPLLAQVLLVAFRRWKKQPFGATTIRELRAFYAALREQSYDLVFDLQGNLKSGLICSLARSRRKIGFSREHLQERLSALFTHEQVGFGAQDRNAVQRYLRVVSAPFGLQPDGREWPADIATGPGDDAKAEKALAAAGVPLVLLHTGTTWQTKLWHEEGWLQLGQELLHHYPGVTLLFSWGTAEEQQRGQALVSQLGEQARLLDRLSLKQFAAVLKRCNLVVGGDTGPVHLAAAVGTPTVSFYRCTDGSRNGPFGERHVIVQSALSCAVCMRKECEHDQDCRRSITVGAMFDAARRLLARQGIVAATREGA